ncbi:MAG: 3-deoxy-manno-octulosonate cytidylyltransferase [Alphaproteobacteria bacterium]
MTRRVCIIPARMASSRFPGKPLAPILGLPMILHIWERCRLARGFDAVVVATCDEEIRAVCAARGAEVVMTADTHPGAVDRCVEAAAKLRPSLGPDDLVLMVQGDEVLVTPRMCEDLITAYDRTGGPVVNLASRIASAAEHDDPNRVKVVTALDGRALYMSRSPIPSRVRDPEVPKLLQTGIIGFSHDFLGRFGSLPRTPLETAEGIDMLRCLEHGLPVQMVLTERTTFGIDTPSDVPLAEPVLRADPTTALYLPRP